MSSDEWISVKDRLPENGQVVAFIVDKSVDYYGGSICAGRAISFDYGPDRVKGMDFSTWGLRFSNSVSYWMPLPPLPKEANR